MGQLILDHRGGTNFDGTKGTLKEYVTVSCPHCQAARAIVLRGCTRQVPFHYKCNRCHEYVCRECAAIMEATKVCPGPFRARVDASLKKQMAGDQFFRFAYNYRT